jgi:outer membrane receptor for ferrienterochelin and colicins
VAGLNCGALLALAITLGGTATAEAGNAQRPLEELTLEELMDVHVDVAAQTPLTARASPNVVTVISREEIVDSGARDLIDLFHRIPSFSFALDITNSVSIGFRGIFGNEGKVLLLVDGIEQNELLYGTTQWGNRYPVDQIERIEIVRGPGSVVYGGYAELAVIHVITRSGADINGASFGTVYGRMGRGAGRTTLSMSHGEVLSNGLDLSVGAFLGRGERSDGRYRSFAGDELDLASASALDPARLSMGASFRGLKLRLQWEHYELGAQDGFGEPLRDPVRENFTSTAFDARYERKVNKRLTITPRFTYLRQTPWQVTDTTNPLYFDVTADRIRGGVDVSQKWSTLQLVGGANGFVDRAHLNNLTIAATQVLFDGEPDVSYANAAAYAQALWDNRIVDVALGGRYAWHSAVGGNFVPRAALTRTLGPVDLKLLYSQAYRMPSIVNLNVGGDLVPEHTTTYELEVAAALGEHARIAGNIFDLTIRDPIIYTPPDPPDIPTEGYNNFPRIGSRGGELELRVRYPRGYATVAYAYANAAGRNEAPPYAVRGHENWLVAAAHHRAAVNGHLTLGDGYSVSTSLLLIGKRYGYLTGDTDDVGQLGVEDPEFLCDINLWQRDRIVRGLELGLGVFDVFGSRLRFLQAYDGGHAPMPGPGRELVARVRYSLVLD